MTKRDRVVLTTAAATMALALLGPSTADANSRRHVFKPGANAVDGATRDVMPSSGAPEVDGGTLRLGLAIVAGGVAVMLGRRRTVRV